MDQQFDVHLRIVRCTVIAVLTAGALGCGSSRHETGRSTFKVLTVNVTTDDSTDSRLMAHSIADMIGDLAPDLVALQGIRRDVVQSDAFDILTSLSDLTGMAYAFGETSADETQRAGNGFLTRHPILEERNILYAKESGLLRLALNIDGSEVTAVTTLLADRTAEAGDELGNLLRGLPAGATVFLGSSGEAANTDVIPSAKGLLNDAWERIGTGSGHTVPSQYPSRRADYVFFSDGRPGFRAFSARVLNTPYLTHLPLWVEFELVAN